MIAFVTSFRSKALATNWEHHVWLLERAIESMLAQSEGECIAVVGCHEVPECSLSRNSRVHFVPVSYPVPARLNDDMCADKVLKLSAASDYAIARGCDYVIFNDADDLVSNRIGAHIQKCHGDNGWYSASQKFYIYGAKVIRHSRIVPPRSGPCVIVRSDLLRFADPPYHGSWTGLIERGGEREYLRLLFRHGQKINTLAAVGLEHYPTFMADEGVPLRPLPFAANVVINHDDSTSHVPGGFGGHYFHTGVRQSVRARLSHFRRIAKLLPTFQIVTERVRNEFLIPAKSAVPIQYRGSGSLFWR